MNILVVGDCHGKVPDIDEEASEADIIVATGDICGDSDEMRKAMFKAIDLEKEWYDVLGREKALAEVGKSLEKGDDILRYLDSFGKPVFLVPGNWDWIGDENWEPLAQDKFQKVIDQYQNVQNINMERCKFQNYCYIGYGPCSGPEIPQYEDDMPEEEELKQLKEEYSRRKEELKNLIKDSERPVILLSHNVPNSTSLDRIENPDSPADGRHYGSVIVKELIEEEDIMLSVAGHIHEGYGKEEIGGTLAINAGLYSNVTVKTGPDMLETVFRPEL